MSIVQEIEITNNNMTLKLLLENYVNMIIDNKNSQSQIINNWLTKIYLIYECSLFYSSCIYFYIIAFVTY